MSKIKKIIVWLLTVVTVCSAFVLPSSAESVAVASPSVSAQSAVLIEAESGEVVYEKSCDTRLPMASTTKIMTALVALELAAPETVIRVDAAAVGVEGSSIYLVAGEELTLEQLLYALLLESANDAAAAIAIGVSGSIEAFADRMNQKAAELGLTDTHFTNPHGLDHEEHYTTARELAYIARAAMQNELFCTIASTRKATIPHAGVDGVRLLINHNKLLRLYDGCIGVKTGYTKRSGRCLVSAAERDGVTLIAVTLNAPSDWNDHTAMLDYGFTRYRSVTLCNANELLYPLSLVNGTDAYVMLGNKEALTVTLPAGAGKIERTVEYRRFEYAPIASGDVCGKVVFRCDTDGDGLRETVGEVDLVAQYSVERLEVKQSFWDWLLSLFSF
ncbi:MAG: D-alanyl-D-alanine carboxypeptidase [Clostridia bacterium]|nr:D-alanyl-D-alanine carboxypeptidase [Clostridia bacterium]